MAKSSNKNDASTKGDLLELKSELKGEMSELRIAIRADIDDVLEQMKFFMSMVQDNFTEVRADIAKIEKDMQRITAALDAHEKRIETSEQEKLVIGHQLDRLDGWVHELADKIGYKLTV